MEQIKTQKNFDYLDKADFGRFQIKVVCVSAIDFFTDAYDLFCINLVMPMIGYVYYYNQPKHAIPGNYDSLVKGSAAWGNLIGQLVFGFLADKYGRKKVVYGYELMIMIISTIGSALAANSATGIQLLGMLGFWRFLLGIGIGGDYPISSVITSEFASAKHRGLMISAVFAIQGCGMLFVSVIALIFLCMLKSSIDDDPINLDYLWRICLGLGVLPAISAICFRMKLSESPRYLALAQKNENIPSEDHTLSSPTYPLTPEIKPKINKRNNTENMIENHQHNISLL